MMTAQERAKLRSLSNSLRDLVYLGKEGLTENVIAQVNDNLYAHELIKIKAQNIIDTYICEQKIPNFITENDFKIEVNYNQI